MKIVKIYDQKSLLNSSKPGLNVRQLLNPLFFERACRHVDMKRQRSRHQRSKDMVQARRLKYAPPTWIPELPETHAWEKWFNQLDFYGWQRRYNDGRWAL